MPSCGLASGRSPCSSAAHPGRSVTDAGTRGRGAAAAFRSRPCRFLLCAVGSGSADPDTTLNWILPEDEKAAPARTNAGAAWMGVAPPAKAVGSWLRLPSLGTPCYVHVIGGRGSGPLPRTGECACRKSACPLSRRPKDVAPRSPVRGDAIRGVRRPDWLLRREGMRVEGPEGFVGRVAAVLYETSPLGQPWGRLVQTAGRVRQIPLAGVVEVELEHRVIRLGTLLLKRVYGRRYVGRAIASYRRHGEDRAHAHD